MIWSSHGVPWYNLLFYERVRPLTESLLLTYFQRKSQEKKRMQSFKKDISRQSTVGADDPFHPREGKTLTWSNVNMTLVRSNVHQTNPSINSNHHFSLI